MLVNIIYVAGQEHLADVCEYSLRRQSPTVVTRRINKNWTDAVLNDTSEQWFLCCYAQVLFLLSPLLLMEHAHPHKSVYKVAGYTVNNSPITLWNNTIAGITLDFHTEPNLVVDDISTAWIGACPNRSPAAIIYKSDMPSEHAELWDNYEEEAANQY